MRIIITVIGLVILASMGVMAFQTTLENAGENEIEVNETFTPSIGSAVELDNSKLNGAYYDEDVTVYNSSDDLMTEGTDYEWYTSNGTIEALSGAGLADGGDGNITYSWQQTTEEQRTFAAMLAQIPNFIGYALPLGILFMFLAFLRG